MICEKEETYGIESDYEKSCYSVLLILAWAIAQGIKFVITYWDEKKIDMTKFWSSGGMPSSHSALVMALSVAVGRSVGFDSPIFAISIMFGMVVMYDAVGAEQPKNITQ